MPTEKLTVTVQAASIRKLDRWVREGRYADRSQAAQAALDLLERRNALPTLEWALAHPNPLSADERSAWDRERQAIDAVLDALEPPQAWWIGGTICYTTVGGLGHAQGTRPVLVIGRTVLGLRTGETIVLPISHVQPAWPYPLSWPVPAGLLPLPAWVLVSRPRAALISGLRDQVATLDREQLDEIATALRQLVEDPGWLA